MNEKQVKDAMEEIRLSAAKKEELWETIAKQRVHQKNKHRKRAVAAAAIFILFLIPTGVYAAGRFSWIWEKDQQKNEELDERFRPEQGCTEIGGFRFCVEQAWCDDKMGISFIYMSVTDVSGEGRDPAEYEGEDETDSRPGRCWFHIGMKASTIGQLTYDKEHSTPQTAYYYVEAEASEDSDARDMRTVKIEIGKTEKGEGGAIKSSHIDEKTITLSNVSQLPVLRWNIETEDAYGKKRVAQVRVSPIIARIRNIAGPEFAIVFRDGTEIADGGFTSAGAADVMELFDQTYRYPYVEIENVRGIRLNGTFYPVEEIE